MGIFGLVSYTTEQKNREIGIRKVLGASVQSIVKLLSREYIVLIIIASAIAFPTAYFMLRSLLMEFLFQTTIGVDIYLLSTGIAMFLALSTSSYLSIKAASANPSDTLRCE